MSQVFSRGVINISSLNYHSDSRGYVLLSFPERLSNFHNSHKARNEQAQGLNIESVPLNFWKSEECRLYASQTHEPFYTWF